MRVTNSMLTSNFLNNLNNSMTRLGGLQGQLATNKKYTHISDDPVSVIYAQQARGKLRMLDIYQGNVSLATSWLTQAETSMTELNKIIQAAYEQAVDASTDVKGEDDRQIISKYVGQLRDHVLTVLNTTIGDKYVFGGHNTTGYVKDGELVPPFGYEEVPIDASDPSLGTKRVLTYNGLDISDPANQAVVDKLMNEVISFDIGAGIRMEISLNGVLGSNYQLSDGTKTNIYNLMDEFTRALETGAGVDEINDFIKPLQDAQSHVLDAIAGIGGRYSRLELMASRYEQDQINYTSMLSDAEDADQAELIMNYKMAEAVYNAALSVGAYIIQPTLMDFLK